MPGKIKLGNLEYCSDAHGRLLLSTGKPILIPEKQLQDIATLGSPKHKIQVPCLKDTCVHAYFTGTLRYGRACGI